MKTRIVTNPPRSSETDITELAQFDVATVHEAIGRTGLLGRNLRPNQQGTKICGTAVTVLCWPGDNLMVHAAVEQTKPGDILVVTTTSESSDGAFGELLATALAQRGVLGLVTTTGVRDTAALRSMPFPVWTPHVHAQGTVKATGGSVNVPIVIGGTVICPGDAILADDDGVLSVPRTQVNAASQAALARESKEAAAREAFRSGELGLDYYNLRSKLKELGVFYVDSEDESTNSE